MKITSITVKTITQDVVDNTYIFQKESNEITARHISEENKLVENYIGYLQNITKEQAQLIEVILQLEGRELTELDKVLGRHIEESFDYADPFSQEAVMKQVEEEVFR